MAIRFQDGRQCNGVRHGHRWPTKNTFLPISMLFIILETIPSFFSVSQSYKPLKILRWPPDFKMTANEFMKIHILVDVWDDWHTVFISTWNANVQILLAHAFALLCATEATAETASPATTDFLALTFRQFLAAGCNGWHSARSTFHPSLHLSHSQWNLSWLIIAWLKMLPAW